MKATDFRWNVTPRQSEVINKKVLNLRICQIEVTNNTDKIRHESSAPYSPHQNGTAERSWRTMFNLSRAMLLESDLLKVLWPYAFEEGF